jgi:hypothetical protein
VSTSEFFANLRDRSTRRFEIIGGPGGYLNVIAVGDPRREDRFRHWVTLARVNRPLSPAMVDQAYSWVHRNFEVV